MVSMSFGVGHVYEGPQGACGEENVDIEVLVPSYRLIFVKYLHTKELRFKLKLFKFSQFLLPNIFESL
jgi:hypothetical protein